MRRSELYDPADSTYLCNMNLTHTVYEPAGQGPHPTIVALHGWGASAMDLLGLAPLLAGGRFLVLCPQGAVEVPLGPMTGYGWFPISMGAPPDPEAFQSALDGLNRFLEDARRRYPIDPEKLVVLGFSQGGVMAYALTIQQPEQFAGLVALSSWLPPTITERARGLGDTRLPILVHHGERDELVSIDRGRESLETLRSLRAQVTYREFDMGHEINPASLRDLSTWLQEKVLSPIVLA